jgi:hypothetical protein
LARVEPRKRCAAMCALPVAAVHCTLDCQPGPSWPQIFENGHNIANLCPH